MSDQRPEWMPIVPPWLKDDVYRAGLRAQIAVLEEIWEEMPSEDFEEDEPLYRKDMVFLKIDALRKELKQ